MLEILSLCPGDSYFLNPWLAFDAALSFFLTELWPRAFPSAFDLTSPFHPDCHRKCLPNSSSQPSHHFCTCSFDRQPSLLPHLQTPASSSAPPPQPHFTTTAGQEENSHSEQSQTRRTHHSTPRILPRPIQVAEILHHLFQLAVGLQVKRRLVRSVVRLRLH